MSNQRKQMRITKLRSWLPAEILLSLNIFLFSTLSGAASLTCHPINGAWVVTNSQGKVLGPELGFEVLKECQAAAKSQVGNLVCTWNGAKYQPYNLITGAGLGLSDARFHFDDLADCYQSIRSQKPDSLFACAWNGKLYAPYVREDNKPVSGDHMGWENLSECVSDAVNQSYGPLICGWSGEPTLYSAKGNALSSDFKDYDDCSGLLKIMKVVKAKANEVADLDSVDPMAGFQNSKPDANIGFPQKECEVKEHNYHLTKSDNKGFIVPECAPDTLYSWGGI